MKKAVSLLLILLAHTPLLAQADSAAWVAALRQGIDSLLEAPMFQTSQVGLMVYDLTADSALYARGERQMLRPASTMKVLTAVTAIDRLGGGYQFRTELCYTGQIAGRTLTGDVYCVGGMDPKFGADDMRAFVESLRRMGVDTIRGRLCADKSMKDSALLGEGWCWDDDNPPLTPLPWARRDRFVERFAEALATAGVVVEATLAAARRPEGAYCVCSRFHTIDQILMRMMKQSDNLYAESMFYQIAASTGQRPATAADARAVMRRVIGRAGLPGDAYKIADGSGLSLYNYVTAELEVMMLRYAWQHQNIYLHLLPALPRAGVDGTLRSRMKGSFTAGNVRAKTGTLTGVYALAGYLTAQNGHLLCFSIINQGVSHSRSAKAFQDAVCELLASPL